MNEAVLIKVITGFSAKMLIATSLIAMTGCTSFFGPKDRGPLDNLDLKGLQAAGYTMGPTGTETPLPVSEEGKPSIVMEVHNGKKHLERIPLPAEKPTFIADIIKDAQLIEKVGRIHVAILRSRGPGLPPVRMEVDFDSKGKNVMEGQNYSLRPGDHVIVYKDTETFLDRLVKKNAPWAPALK